MYSNPFLVMGESPKVATLRQLNTARDAHTLFSQGMNKTEIAEQLAYSSTYIGTLIKHYGEYLKHQSQLAEAAKKPHAQVSDMGAIAFLQFLGFKYERVEADHANRVSFFFEDTAELQEALDKFHSGTATVDPKRYCAALRGVKSVIRSVLLPSQT